MNNFKKFFIAMLLCNMRSVFAASCEVVQPINPQEGIWNVMTRIGLGMDILAQRAAGTNCDFFITQTNIGVGNAFVITGSNATYCLSQTVTFNTGFAIKISGSSITLDLQGHIIDGRGMATQGIVIAHGAQNVIIQNGIIQNIGGTGNNGYAIADDSGNPIINNVVIRNMSFNNNAQGAIIFGLGTQPSVTDLLIEDCTSFNSDGISVSTNGAIVRRCTLYENRGIGFGCDIVLSGLSASQLAVYATVEDCIVTCSVGVKSTAQIITNFVQNSLIINSISMGSLLNGFRFNEFQDVAVINCIAQTCGDSGFTFTAPLAVGASVSNVVLEGCVAQGCGESVGIGNGFQIVQTTNGGYQSLKFLNCVSQFNAQNGFLLDHNPGTMRSSGILFQGCYALGNSANGFLIVRRAGDGTWTELVFDDCVSQNNSGHGFAIENQASDMTISNIVFRNCTAQANVGGSFGGSTFSGDGFGIGSSTLNAGPISNVLFQGCVAETNSNDGFDFSVTSSNVKFIDSCALRNSGYGFRSTGTQMFFFGNTSINNTTGDYLGITDPTQVVSYSFAGALNGAGKWVNVKS